MNDETYNGWPNRETWLVALWVQNDEPVALHVSTIIDDAWHAHPTDLARRVAQAADEMWSMFGPGREGDWGWYDEMPGMMRDLLRASLDRVQWRVLAETWLTDAR